MTQIIQAVYEQGVFRPLEPVTLGENERVVLAVSGGLESSADSPEVMERQRLSLRKLREEMDSLPSHAPDDGLGGADHDLILYGRSS